MIAVDGAGDEVSVLTWYFAVQPKPLFETTTAWQQQEKGIAHLQLDNSNYHNAYTVDETYTLAKPNLPKGDAFTGYAQNDASKITYSLVFTNRTSTRLVALPFYTNSQGETLAQPKKEHVGTYTARLVATDASGESIDMYTWDFEVQPKPLFETTTAWQGKGIDHLQLDKSNYNNAYTVGETYTLAKPNLPKGDAFTGYAQNDASKITYSLAVTNLTSNELVSLPFYTNSQGETLAEPKTEHVGNYSCQMMATDPAGSIASMYAWNFSIKQRDQDIPHNG